MFTTVTTWWQHCSCTKLQQREVVPMKFANVFGAGQGIQDFVFLCFRERHVVCV